MPLAFAPERSGYAVGVYYMQTLIRTAENCVLVSLLHVRAVLTNSQQQLEFRVTSFELVVSCPVHSISKPVLDQGIAGAKLPTARSSWRPGCLRHFMAGWRKDSLGSKEASALSCLLSLLLLLSSYLRISSSLSLLQFSVLLLLLLFVLSFCLLVRVQLPDLPFELDTKV